MNILADESIDHQVVGGPRDAGHSVLYIAEIDPSVTDDVVYDIANRSRSV